MQNQQPVAVEPTSAAKVRLTAKVLPGREDLHQKVLPGREDLHQKVLPGREDLHQKVLPRQGGPVLES